MAAGRITLRSHDDRAFDAYLAVPPCGAGPGLLLLPEDGGLDAPLCAFADQLAEEGYLACVPDFFRRFAPLHSRGDAAAAADPDRTLALRDVEAVAEQLRRQPAFRGQVGALGFGIGGSLALLAAADGIVQCAIGYDVPGLAHEAALLGRIRMPLLLHFGGADAGAPSAVIEAIRAALGGRSEAEVRVYPGAARGFAKPAVAARNASAASMAYSRSLGLLRRVLGPYYDLSALWEAHRACEFETRDADATMRTMVEQPYVNHVPTLTGGFGQADLHRFYRDHFIPNNPKDMMNIPISRTVGVDRVVNEGVLSFTHDCEIEWMLPGVAATGRRVEVALVGIITFRGDKLAHEHIYWDQASVLVQVGLLDPRGLPVAGAESARKVLQPQLPSNALMPNWRRNSSG